MKIKTVLCDDNEKARYIIKEYIKRINIEDIDLIGESKNGYELIEFCKSQKTDLILLDIDMPLIDGIETAKKIQNFLPHVSFIFITAFSNFSLQAFEVHAVDYILKPISLERLENSLRYVVKRINSNTSKFTNYLTLKCGHELYSISHDEILFIERVGRKTLIHTYAKELPIYESLNSLQSKLNSENFVRSHNSYLVNINLINSIGKSIKNDYEIYFRNYSQKAYASRRNVPRIRCNSI